MFGHRLREIGPLALLGAMVVLLALLRLAGLETDPPYDIATDSGALITDEGWYTKSAQSLARDGELRHPMDRNIYTHTIAYTLTTAATFELGGVSLRSARLLSVFSFWASLVFFFLIARSAQPISIALMGCLVIVAHFQSFTFSRLAFAEPLAVSFSLAAIYLWIKNPRSPITCGASMSLASLALFSKLSFVLTWFTVFGLWISSVIRMQGGRTASASLRIAMTAGFVSISMLSILLVFSTRGSEDWLSMQRPILRDQATEFGVSEVTIREYSAVRDLLTQPGRAVLASSMGLGVLSLLLIRGRNLRRELFRPATAAMLAWFMCGLFILSAFRVQPSRYYYFLTFPLAYLALQGARWIGGRRNWIAVGLFVVILSLTEQIPSYLEWWQRGVESTYADAARDIAKIVTQGEGEPFVLLGLNASFVSLFDDRIRPLELHYVPRDILCQRIAFWRPAYLVHFLAPMQDLEPLCPGQLHHLEVVKTYTVMDRWYFGSDMVLARISYGTSR